jgi:hypothetical protein
LEEAPDSSKGFGYSRSKTPRNYLVLKSRKSNFQFAAPFTANNPNPFPQGDSKVLRREVLPKWLQLSPKNPVLKNTGVATIFPQKRTLQNTNIYREYRKIGNKKGVEIDPLSVMAPPLTGSCNLPSR